MKLSDEVVAHIAQVLQIAIITGTDVVDNMRMIVLEEKDNILYLDKEYSKNSDLNIEKMLEEAEGGE